MKRVFPTDPALDGALDPRLIKRVVGVLILVFAAVILGSGSASFEMMRYLTERLPAMTVPRWVDNRIQPIAIRDVLRYLVGSATMPADVNRAFDIGGPDVLTYRQMMQGYARAAGLPQRLIVKVPVLSPSLSSHWVGLVTPVPSGLARPLVESLIHEVVCDEHDIARYVPDPPEGLVGFDRAVRLALERVRDGETDPDCLVCRAAGRQGILKSDTISFGQNLVPDVIERAMAAAEGCDLLLAIGSTLQVYPVASMVPLARQTGASVIIVNAQPTGMDDHADVVLRGQIGDILPALVAP